MNNLELITDSSNFIENVQLKFLASDDIPALKKLCTEWFPIKYPDAWYRDVTSSSDFFSLAAVHNNELIGVMISTIRHRSKCNKEDSDIIGFWYPSTTNVGYILILGVVKEYRRKGIASFLLNAFLSRVNSLEFHYCKAVYLHVLASNANAVLFYERNSFKRHKHLPLYYAINGSRMDGYCYVLYVNNGGPPWTLRDAVNETKHFLSHFSLCRATHFLLMRLWIVPSRLFLSTLEFKGNNSNHDNHRSMNSSDNRIIRNL